MKLGAFRLAVETGAPVVPIAIRGTRRALRDGAWLPRPGPLEVEVGAPIRPPPAERGFAAYVELREAAAAAIAAMIDEPRVG
jgi:1-acyl-sn-glycerol-3-phosphate acyltransferase